MIKDDNLEFDLILVRLRSKIALSSGWPPTSNQSFLSLCSHKGHKASKIVSASRLRCSHCNLRRICFWDVLVNFPSNGSQPSLAFLALQVCCTWYVGMCLNNGYSLASIISGFGFFFFFLLCSGGNFSNFLSGLEVLTRGKTSVEIIYHMAPKSLTPCQFIIYLAFG